MSKLRSFTIMEVTIALLLSTVLIMLCYKSYELLSRTMKVQTHHSKNKEEELLLRKALMNDVYSSEMIISTDSGFMASLDSVKIHYVIQDTLLMRIGSKRDTFHYEKMELKQWDDSTLVYTPNTIINKIEFRIRRDEQEFLIRLTKNAASEVYLNKED